MNFDDFLNTYAGAPPELPLVHNTLCLRLPQLQSTGVLEPRDCCVFGEPLLYFFYGRPVFEPDGIGDEPDTCFDFWPVCFVFKPGALASWARVFPLDSGAVNGGRFLPLIEQCDLKPLRARSGGYYSPAPCRGVLRDEWELLRRTSSQVVISAYGRPRG
jgi:hypothetical protein